jgi:hypothetical protein
MKYRIILVSPAEFVLRSAYTADIYCHGVLFLRELSKRDRMQYCFDVNCVQEVACGTFSTGCIFCRYQLALRSQ